MTSAVSFFPIGNTSLLTNGERRRFRACRLALSEIMTILVYFHQSPYRNFKAYYLLHLCRYPQGEFPNLLSYNRFVALIPTVLMPLCVYLQTRTGAQTGIAFIDSTSLVVCHNRRIHSHKVFKTIARRGKTSMGWFYGFKLLSIITLMEPPIIGLMEPLMGAPEGCSNWVRILPLSLW